MPTISQIALRFAAATTAHSRWSHTFRAIAVAMMYAVELVRLLSEEAIASLSGVPNVPETYGLFTLGITNWCQILIDKTTWLAP